MRKVLLGTTALGAAALLAGPVAAQDGKISLGVGGYYQNFLTFTEQDYDGTDGNDYHEFQVRHEGEIHFKGETTLDNGLTVGFQAQLEALTSGDQMDETYMYFTGSWGRLVLGSENSAADLMQYAAPAAGLGVNSPNFAPFRQNSSAGTSTYLNRTSDANKITYFTPRFGGFQLGVSYTPNVDAVEGNSQSHGLVTSEDVGDQANFFTLGANFVNSFGGFDIAVAAGLEYGFLEQNDALGTFDDHLGLSTGVNFGFAGFTIGGSILHSNNGFDNDGDTLVWDAGITYGRGPWEIGFTYLNGDRETNPGEDDIDRFELGGNYGLSPGVTVVGALQYTRDEDESADREEDAWGVIIGTKLSF
jgi:predicted porin